MWHNNWVKWQYILWPTTQRHFPSTQHSSITHFPLCSKLHAASADNSKNISLNFILVHLFKWCTCKDDLKQKPCTVNAIRSFDISFLYYVPKKHARFWFCSYLYGASGNIRDTKLQYLFSESGLYHSKPFVILLYFFNKYRYHCHLLNWLLNGTIWVECTPAASTCYPR
jgi:hypothetical protein